MPLVPKPIVRRIAAPYIAGESLDEQLATIAELNEQGFMVATAILGELVTRKEESTAAVAQYEEVLAAVAERQLDSNIHVKLTHLGLHLDKQFCYENVRQLLTAARERDNFVRIDMEDAPTTDDTLQMHARLEQEFDNVGVVIQACMRRSLADVGRLVEARANVRLCKGIYIEPRRVAYLERDVIRRNYSMLLEELLGGGCYVGIATHDEWLVQDALRTVHRLGVESSQYEFQMLHGVDPQLRRIVRDAGHRLRVAVPFGPSWYPYSVRRLRKNPRIARYVLQALLKGDRT